MSSTICYKVILIGNCRVGKTSYLNFVIGRNSNKKNSSPPTIGVQYAPITIKASGEDIRVNIWDTCTDLYNYPLAGAEQYKSITSSYYRKCQGAIIMFDVTDKKSFIDLKMWMEEIKAVGGSKLIKILLANKNDLAQSGEKQKQVTQEEIIDFCLQNELEFKYTSAMTGYNVKSSFNWLIQKIYLEKHTERFQNPSQSIDFVNNNNSVSIQQPKKTNSSQVQHLNCSKCC